MFRLTPYMYAFPIRFLEKLGFFERFIVSVCSDLFCHEKRVEYQFKGLNDLQTNFEC